MPTTIRFHALPLVLALLPLALFAGCDDPKAPAPPQRYNAAPTVPPDGPVTEYYDAAKTKKRAEGAVKSGKPDGRWTFWHENGTKASEGEFASGAHVGAWTYFHPNGQKQSEARFVADKIDGPVTEWHDNGQVARKASYVAG
ncbi:MAG: hypothetical protein IPJ77_16785, partial [Planctomycetes bacterium]|nr:hypothetical protein [Planctomycetota bacterium]